MAISTDEDHATALNLPTDAHGRVRLMLWSGGEWLPVPDIPTPPISSKLAWLENGSVIYESEDRALSVYDPAHAEVQAVQRAVVPPRWRIGDDGLPSKRSAS